ncbi:MAG: hypothetical protein GY849_13370 [Deltaproteobacteria bacterium]|nr:hypothetical protein [Deltaproteobacteria bacterium]
MIESFAFGSMVIDGKDYASDLMIYPDGRVKDAWIRKRGHGLIWKDMAALIETGPEVIIAGTGVSGGVIPEDGLRGRLLEKGIELIAAPNKEAVDLYNLLSSEKRVGACFHLTC